METALLSGRFGDWVYYVRNGRQFRRRYVVPKDPRTPGQLRTRATFAAASKYWSRTLELTDQERNAWETAANRIQSRPRLDQSGPLTGQQYFVGQACAKGTRLRRTSARQVAECGIKRPARPLPQPQTARAQGNTGTTPEPPVYIVGHSCGMGAAPTGSTRRSRRKVSILTRPGAGVGGERRVNIRSQPGACRMHVARSSGDIHWSVRCGSRKVLGTQGLPHCSLRAPPPHRSAALTWTLPRSASDPPLAAPNDTLA